jgi:hypothetical protein
MLRWLSRMIGSSIHYLRGWLTICGRKGSSKWISIYGRKVASGRGSIHGRKAANRSSVHGTNVDMRRRIHWKISWHDRIEVKKMVRDIKRRRVCRIQKFILESHLLG